MPQKYIVVTTKFQSETVYDLAPVIAIDIIFGTDIDKVILSLDGQPRLRDFIEMGWTLLAPQTGANSERFWSLVHPDGIDPWVEREDTLAALVDLDERLHPYQSPGVVLDEWNGSVFVAWNGHSVPAVVTDYHFRLLSDDRDSALEIPCGSYRFRRRLTPRAPRPTVRPEEPQEP